MNLSEDVDLEEFVTAKDDLSGADIKAVCTEAGLLALRERRMRVTKADLEAAREKVGPFLFLQQLYLHLSSFFPSLHPSPALTFCTGTV
jgi:SpoVK/Ycf46/Vps4 family AAA+-type ATPase